MENRYLLPATVIAACVMVLWFTGGKTNDGEIPIPETELSDPIQFPRAVHIADHGVRFGTTSDSNVIVRREDGKIRVEIQQDFLVQLPDTFLSILGWEKPINWVTDEGYEEFLDALDSIYHSADDEEHEEHEHGSDEVETATG